jgi:hypothetical protein
MGTKVAHQFWGLASCADRFDPVLLGGVQGQRASDSVHRLGWPIRDPALFIDSGRSSPGTRALRPQDGLLFHRYSGDTGRAAGGGGQAWLNIQCPFSDLLGAFQGESQRDHANQARRRSDVMPPDW